MNKFRIIIILATAAAVSSCSDFLKEYNPSGLSDIYDEENLLESSVEGVMAGFLSGNALGGESTEAFPIASGLIHWGQSSQRMDSNKWLSCLRFTQYSTNDWNPRYFQSIYNPVFRANNLLAELPESPVDESLKIEIEAEARFYRAVAYFIIVRTWGDAPLWLEAVNEWNASNKPRSPYYKVYEQIVRDLEFAEENMRSPERVEQVGSRVVRPHKYAATAFLSSVYTTIGSLLDHPDDNFWDPSKEGRAPDFSAIGVSSAADAYIKALSYAERLIPESDSHDPGCHYRLLTKFGDLFTYDNGFSRDGYTSWKHPEQIFTLPVSIATSVRAYAQYQLPQYPEGTIATINNEQFGRIRPTRWAFQKWCETYPGRWRNSEHTEYVTSSDPRLDITFYYNSMQYCQGMSFYDTEEINIYPQTITYGRVGVAPYFRKYASPNYNVNSGDADIYVMRFAEVYFNAAEAAFYLGDRDKAFKYVDVVHARARHSVPDGMPDSDNPRWEEGRFATRDEFMTGLFWERIFEFFGENHEYFETHRHGAGWLVENIAKPKNEFLSQPHQEMLFSRYYPDGFRYSVNVEDARKGLLAGFPQTEVLYNAGIQEYRNDFDFGL